MEIKFYEPSDLRLRKYIECFYFLTRQPEEKSVVYAAFPGTGYFVTTNENSRSVRRNDYKSYIHRQGAPPVSELIYNFEKPHFIEYRGAASELNICFKPLGINAFLDRKLSYYCSDYSTPFYPFDDYREHLADLCATENVDDKLARAQNYWLSKLKGFAHPFLERVIEEFENDDRAARTISEIAADHRASRATLHKQFTDHLCASPVRFRKVVRFRRAMKKHAVKRTIENLTDISQLVDYFDQSHMIKDFKALTNHSPKSFFSKITPLEGGRLNWKFL